MTDNNNGAPTQDQPTPKDQQDTQSIAGVIFDTNGSAILNPLLLNVNPNQILLAAGILDTIARRMLNDMWTTNAQNEQMRQAEMGAMMQNLGVTVQNA